MVSFILANQNLLLINLLFIINENEKWMLVEVDINLKGLELFILF